MNKVKYHTKEEAKRIIETIPEGKKIAIVPQVTRRTISQNKLLHLYFNIISDRMCEIWDEMTPDILKEVLKQKIWITFERKEELYPKPTHLYDTKEMKQFIDNMQVFSKKYLQLELPNPDDRELLLYYQENFM